MGASLRLMVAFAISSSFTRSFEFVGHCIFVCFVLSPFVVLRERARNAPGSTKTGLVATPMTLPASVSHVTPALCWRGWIVRTQWITALMCVDARRRTSPAQPCTSGTIKGLGAAGR